MPEAKTKTSEPLIDRRLFVTALTGLITGAVGNELGTYHLHKAHQTLANFVLTSSERLDLAAGIFFPKDVRLDVVPARHHPTLKLAPDELTYANEWEAVKAIRKIFGPATEIVPELYAASDHNSLISVGSSASNLLSRSVLGSPRSPKTVFETSQLLANLHFTIKELPGTQVRRLQDGHEHTVPRRAVVGRNEELIAFPDSSNGELRSDVLLVTRIPRALGGPEITIFAGLHGPAIRAVEHLLFSAPVTDLMRLKEMLETQTSSKYFQAIFRVDGLVEQDETTKPSAIHLLDSEDAKPRIVDIHLR